MLYNIFLLYSVSIHIISNDIRFDISFVLIILLNCSSCSRLIDWSSKKDLSLENFYLTMVYFTPKHLISCGTELDISLKVVRMKCMPTEYIYRTVSVSKNN